MNSVLLTQNYDFNEMYSKLEVDSRKKINNSKSQKAQKHSQKCLNNYQLFLPSSLWGSRLGKKSKIFKNVQKRSQKCPNMF